LMNEKFITVSGYSVVRLARLLWEQEVAGSNPATPTKQKAMIEKFVVFFCLRLAACPDLASVGSMF
jgi:hypothetical protein